MTAPTQRQQADQVVGGASPAVTPGPSSQVEGAAGAKTRFLSEAICHPASINGMVGEAAI
jgi:hypothetical protein